MTPILRTSRRGIPSPGSRASSGWSAKPSSPATPNDAQHLTIAKWLDPYRVADDGRSRKRVLNQERRDDERDRREQLDEDVQGRSGGVLERIADRVADD